MDLRIAPEVNDNVDVMPFVVDHPHIRVSGAGRRTKVPEERTRVPRATAWGFRISAGVGDGVTAVGKLRH